MKKTVMTWLLWGLAAVAPLEAQQPGLPVALVKMPYSGARNVPELSGGPD